MWCRDNSTCTSSLMDLLLVSLLFIWLKDFIPWRWILFSSSTVWVDFKMLQIYPYLFPYDKKIIKIVLFGWKFQLGVGVVGLGVFVCVWRGGGAKGFKNLKSHIYAAESTTNIYILIIQPRILDTINPASLS